MYNILAINPGSTSTKIGVFKGIKLVSSAVIRHDAKKIQKFPRAIQQLDLRLESINRFIDKNKIDLQKIDFFIGRGGYLKPLKGGLYQINKKMIEDLRKEKYGDHGSNLGAIIADHYAKRFKKESYIIDPVSVDELDPIARISGHPLIEKKSVFHALNQKRIARSLSGKLGQKYERLNLIIAHLGGGISIGLHHLGKIVDVNDAINGEGPFSPERAGALPGITYLKYVFKNNLSLEDSIRMVYGKGGLAAYFGTSDFDGLMKRYGKGNDKKLMLVIDAMAYQISKSIASLAAPVSGKIDGIAITGGLAYSGTFIDLILKKIKYLTENIFIFPGEDELTAMAEGVLMGVNKEIRIQEYK